METVKLTPEYAEAVADLEQRVYPSELVTGVDTIRENLTNAENDGENVSWGVFSGNHMVGYCMAWVQSSMLEGREREDVVLLEDIALLPGHQSSFLSLLEAMTGDMRALGFGRLPIEGASRAAAFKVFSKHGEIFKNLGYTLVASQEYWDEEFSETMTWVRFEPLEEDYMPEPELRGAGEGEELHPAEPSDVA